MATDIAFALGILALLGNRVPSSIKIFLTALAIVDDLGAVLVIALFYSSEVSTASLAAAAGFWGLLLACNWAGVRAPAVYAFLGIGGLWLAFLFSGVHPTIAGVLSALAIPARSKIDSNQFLVKSGRILEEFRRPEEAGRKLIGKRRYSALLQLRLEYEKATTPLQRLEKAMHPWVVFVVMPLFAFANAGVQIEGDVFRALGEPLALGIIFGLVVGKQLGITAFAWAAVKFRLAVLPAGVRFKQIYLVSWLGGIGFTMSLFVATLAFESPVFLSQAKVAILAASILAGSVGYVLLRRDALAALPIDGRESNSAGTH